MAPGAAGSGAARPRDLLTEPAGRYGGLADYLHQRPGRTPITVECSSVVAALDDVLRREGTIDLVKIDTEGSEDALVEAIPPRIWARIGALAYEDSSGHVVWRHGTRGAS